MAGVTDDDDAIGRRFARAITSKDRPALLELLHPDVDFRGMTPGRVWEAATAAGVIDDVVLGAWFQPSDRIDEVERVETGAVVDRRHVVYRVRVTNADGSHVVEQQAYFDVEDDRITSLRMLCSGYRPVAAQR